MIARNSVACTDDCPKVLAIATLVFLCHSVNVGESRLSFCSLGIAFNDFLEASYCNLFSLVGHISSPRESLNKPQSPGEPPVPASKYGVGWEASTPLAKSERLCYSNPMKRAGGLLLFLGACRIH